MPENIEKFMDNFVKLKIIVQNPTLDLEEYVTSYSYMWKFYRLIFVADVSPTYRVEALQIAINDVKKTFNVEMYKFLFKKLNDCTEQNGQLEDPQLRVFDLNWVNFINREAELLTKKLNTDLQNMKGNSMQGSIKNVYEELGEHYLNCGEIFKALNAFFGARDYCTNRADVIRLNVNILKIKIFYHEWTSVVTYIEDLKNFPNDTEYPLTFLYTQLKCYAGLAEMQRKNYKLAVLSFVASDFEYCDKLEMLSANNVATYVIICALAAMGRDELLNVVLKSKSFKSFLELEPQLAEVADQFTKGKYDFCLTTLDNMRDNLMIDMYLSEHLDSLYAQIRNRALIQYFSPYNEADMDKMAKVFNVTEMQLENELEKLIMSDRLEARIDSCGKKLVRYVHNARRFEFERVLISAIQFEKLSKMLIVRQAMSRANICVKMPEVTSESEDDIPL